MKNVCIIGGGIGGLFTGAILSKEGCTVTVLEKNAVIGGGLQCFRRSGEVFESAMHILVGLQPGGNIRRILDYLGITGRLAIRETDPDCTDSLHYHSDGVTYYMGRGPEAFIDSLAASFPDQREGLRAYVDHVYEMASRIDLFNLRESGDYVTALDLDFIEPVDAMIARFVTDPRLRDILGFINPMYGGVAGHTPAYIHALLCVLEINGPCRFDGGSQQLAEALRDVIVDAGGEVLAACPAVRVAVEGKEVQYVLDGRGRRHTADIYISAIHPCALVDIIDEGAFTKAFVNRVQSVPNTYSAFTVYIKLKPGSFPYINHTCYYQDDYGLVWDYDVAGEDWPRGLMYLTPPVKDQGEYAATLIVTTPMPFEEVGRWENTKVGRRGPEYEAWKSGKARALIDKMRRMYPDIDSCIESWEASSPLTIRDYFNVKDGSMYGFRKDCDNIVLSQLPVATKVRNLLLTGQNINLHGICGVPLTAVTTAEAVLGRNHVIRSINRATRQDAGHDRATSPNNIL